MILVLNVVPLDIRIKGIDPNHVPEWINDAEVSTVRSNPKSCISPLRKEVRKIFLYDRGVTLVDLQVHTGVATLSEVFITKMVIGLYVADGKHQKDEHSFGCSVNHI